MTKRVVITGLGITSCLGTDAASVIQSLRDGKSGISVQQGMIDAGMRSHIGGSIDLDLKEHIDRKQLRFMGQAAAYTYISKIGRAHV